MPLYDSMPLVIDKLHKRMPSFKLIARLQVGMMVNFMTLGIA